MKQLGALLSDLIAHSFALLAENEQGTARAQRLREIRATIAALSRLIDAISLE